MYDVCPGSCCDQIEVVSTGQALLDQPLYIGLYTRQPALHNGQPVYVRERAGAGATLYTYFFVSEEHGVSLWVVGPQLGQFRAGIRNSGRGSCVHDLATGWKFAARSGVWADTDPSLRVQCRALAPASDTGARVFESKKLRPRPRAFEPRVRVRDCSWSGWVS